MNLTPDLQGPPIVRGKNLHKGSPPYDGYTAYTQGKGYGNPMPDASGPKLFTRP